MTLDFTKSIVLENDIALLRPLELSDKEHLIGFGINEPEIWKYNINGGNGKENFERYFTTALEQFSEKKQYPFVVYDKRYKKHVGMTRYYDISEEFSRLEIGWTWYGTAYQGTGLNKNCKFLLLDYAFEKLDARRVGFGANTKNKKSIDAMKSIGCTIEGVLRDYSRDAEGNVIDSVKLSILKREWDKDLKNKLRNQISTYALNERFGFI